ncbi:MAG TPA: peptidase M3, partial [Microbacterium sp.]|nr:peptidase M3 [Microbacterium sp.]
MTLAPLPFPSDAAGWAAFATDRPAERIARVHGIDARLTSEAALTTAERLELWNDADIALAEALSEA